MAATLAARVDVKLNLTYQNTVGLALATAAAERAFLKALASGVGADQADKCYTESAKSIAASGNYDLDLAGTLTDAFGAVITFVRIKLVAIFADPGNTNNVIIGNAAATQFVGWFGAATHTAHVRPGGMAMFCAPDATAWTVGAGTTDLLRLTNSAAGTPVLVDIVIVGASA